MSEPADLAKLVEQPFELLAEIERRSRQAHAGEGAGSMPAEWVGVGFRIGDEQFLATELPGEQQLCQQTGTQRIRIWQAQVVFGRDMIGRLTENFVREFFKRLQF